MATPKMRKDGRFTSLKKKKNNKEKKFEVLVGDPEAATAAAFRFSLDGPKRKRITKAQLRPWSDLPADLIGDLVAALSPVDQIRFGAACRNYRLSNLFPQNHHDSGDHSNNHQVLVHQQQLPWLVKYEVCGSTADCGMECKLFCPIGRKEAYAIYTIMNQEDRFSAISIQVLACKRDWMFFSWSDPKIFRKDNLDQSKIDGARNCFLLFSPFTKQIVTTLPCLDRTAIFADLHPLRGVELGTFSSHPSSPDCVYFVSRHYSSLHVISTFRQGDTDWTSQIFHDDDGLNRFQEFHSVVFFEGSFYLVSDKGNLARYNVLERDWKYVIGSDPLSLQGPVLRLTHLLVHDGQLLLACVDSSPDVEDEKKKKKKNENNKDRCSVFVFSRSTSSWIKQTSLGDHALFLGCTSFSVSTTAAASASADKIFYHKSIGSSNKKEALCYSLKDDDFCPSVYTNCPGIAHSGIWIQPPHCMPTQPPQMLSQLH